MKQTLKDLTRKSVFLSMMLLACSGIFAKSKTKWAVNPELPMSVRMCQSEIIRNPEGWMLDFSTKLKWNYCHGLECQALQSTSKLPGRRPRLGRYRSKKGAHETP